MAIYRDDTEVWATTVRAVDPPQFIAEIEDQLEEGRDYGLEQCDRCGNTTYALVMHGGHWYVRCTPNPDGIYGGIEGVGCGAEYPVYKRHAEEVVF